MIIAFTDSPNSNAEATPAFEQLLDATFSIIDDFDRLLGNEKNQDVTLQAQSAPTPVTSTNSTMMSQMMPFSVLINCAK